MTHFLTGGNQNNSNVFLTQANSNESSSLPTMEQIRDVSV